MSGFLFTSLLLLTAVLFAETPHPLPSESAVLQRASQMEVQEAVSLLRQKLGDKPSAAARHSLGVWLYLAKDYSAACAEFQHVLSQFPDYAECRGNLAKAFAAMGRHREAATAARQALNTGIVPALPMFMLLAHSEAAQQNWDAAENAVRGALALDPEHITAIKMLLQILQASGKYQEAVNAATAAARKFPRQSIFWQFLASSARLAGDDIAAEAAEECAKRLKAK